MNVFMNVKKASAFLILPSVLLFATSCGKREVIEEIGDSEVTTKVYEDYYTTYLEKMVRLGNVEKKNLYNWICHPEEGPPGTRALLQGLDPQNNYREFRDNLTVEAVARAEGFQDRPIVRQILEQVQRELLVRLYLAEKMDSRIRISEDEKKKKCEELRREYPDRVAHLTIEQCLQFAESQLKDAIMVKEYPKLIEEVKEGVKITRNPNFNRDEYLDKKFEIYRTMRREGGCEANSSQATPNSTPVQPGQPAPAGAPAIPGQPTR